MNALAESRITAAMAFLEPIEVVESARGGTQSFMHPGTPRPHPTPCMGFASTPLQLKVTSLDPKVNYSDFMDSVNRGDVEMVRVQAGYVVFGDYRHFDFPSLGAADRLPTFSAYQLLHPSLFSYATSHLRT